jgi:hypothetical protein
MDPLTFLLYVSQSTDSLENETQRALREKALLNAGRTGVTGILFYRRGFFMQYLEGPEQVVLDLFRELRGTNRHHNVRVLSRGPLESRLFTDWTVRWVNDEETGPSSESLIDLFETVLSSKTVSPNEISAILKRFGKNSKAIDLPLAEAF